MSVDKFGRRFGNRTVTQETCSSDVSVIEMNDYFLRRDSSNTAVSVIKMNGNTLTNVRRPTHNLDAANKVYVNDNVGGGGPNKVSKSGDWCGDWGPNVG